MTLKETARLALGMLRGGAAALALLALSACALPEQAPTYFYLLDPIEPAAERPSGGAVRLAVEEVEIPAYLDRQDIVSRDGANQVQVSGLHQWAEPLNGTVTRVLAENLRLLLDSTEVIELPSYRDTFNAELYLSLLRFERDADGKVTLVATWEVMSGDRRNELSRERAVIRAPVADSAGLGTGEGARYEAIVAAMNEALSELSRRVAESLRQAGAAT